MDSIAIVESFFGGQFTSSVGMQDILALPEDQLEELLTRVFDETGSGAGGFTRAPVPEPAEGADPRWAAAFHSPSSLFSPRRVIEEASRLLPMTLYLDRIAIFDPLSAVAEFGPPDKLWRSAELSRTIRRKAKPSRSAFERLRRLRVAEAIRVLEKVAPLRDRIRLVPARNWASVVAGSQWDFSIQLWALDRSERSDAELEWMPPRPDPSRSFAEYLRGSGVTSMVVGDDQSWGSTLVGLRGQGRVDSAGRLAELLLLHPLNPSGVDLRRIIEDDTAMATVRSAISGSLQMSLSLPSDDAADALREAFERSRETLEKRKRSSVPGLELAAAGTAIGGVLVDLAITGTTSPSVVVAGMAAQVPLFHGVYERVNASRASEAVSGSLLRLASPKVLEESAELLSPEPMAKATSRAHASRVLADLAVTCPQLGLWPPRAIWGERIITDVIAEWLYDEGAEAGADSYSVVFDQANFDSVLAMIEGLHPIEPNGTWAVLVADCLSSLFDQDGVEIVGRDPLVVRLRRPAWM